MALRIFISYRREDAPYAANHIGDRLREAFGRNNVFMDIHTMVAGQDFQAVIDRYIDQSRVMIAIIGNKWVQFMTQLQAANKKDWVLYEIQRAMDLKRIVVVPVCVDGFRIATAANADGTLGAMARAHALEFRGIEHFEADVRELIDHLKRIEPPPEPKRPWDQRTGRAYGAIMLALTVMVMLALWWWRDVRAPAKPDEQALGNLVYQNCWVAYDPSGMKLDDDRRPIFPDEASVAADLDLIRTAGFSGIVTSTSNDVMERVPRMAQERGLRVIMGVWNPGDPWELARAIRQSRYVDAYCIGHEGYPNRYSLDQLERAVLRVKQRTGKPATASELAIHYTPQLSAIGDWLFPDAHLTIREGDDDYRVDVDRDLERFMKATQTVIPFAQQTGRPVLFHNVAYPYDGVTGASRMRQAEFYRRLLERVNDPQRGHTIKVAIVPQTAFDTQWKLGKPFYPWDPYCGLIEPDPTAASRRFDLPSDWDGPMSPAGRAIRHWFPHLEAAREGRSPNGRPK